MHSRAVRIGACAAWLVLLGPLSDTTAWADEAVRPDHEAELEEPREPGLLETLLPWSLPVLGLAAIALVRRHLSTEPP